MTNALAQKTDSTRMPEIAPATDADITQLCELLAILFTQEEDFTPDAEKQYAGLQRIIGDPAIGRILVLRDGENIIGMVGLLFTVSTACGGKVAQLEDMVIRPDMRRKGLGSRLLHAAIEHATREGCLRVTLLTDRANEAAIRFYQRNGFATSLMVPLRLATSR